MGNAVINKSASTVFINKRGVIVDLGGIAKGYMVDRAIGALKENNIKSGSKTKAKNLFLWRPQLR